MHGDHRAASSGKCWRSRGEGSSPDNFEDMTELDHGAYTRDSAELPVGGNGNCVHPVAGQTITRV